MSIEMKLTFPPATGNHTTKICFNTKRFYTLPQIKLYRLAIACDVAKSSLGQAIGVPVRVSIGITPPDRRRRDSGNIIKVLYDALTRAGLWADDSLVREEHITWNEPSKPGWIDMRVEVL